MAACIKNTRIAQPISELRLWLSLPFAAVPCAIAYLYVPSQCPPLWLGRGAAPGIAGDRHLGSFVLGRTHLPAWLPAWSTGKVGFFDWQVQLQFFVCFAGLIERNHIDKVLQEFRIEVGEATRG